MAGSNVVEVIPRRLFWISAETPPRGISQAYYFNLDRELSYAPFCSDFGPLNIAKIYWYIRELQKIVSAPENAQVIFYHHTSTDSRARVNSAFAAGCYMIERLGLSAEEVSQRFCCVMPAFVAFRDASPGPCSHECTLRHCLRGFEHGLRAGLINMQSFDLKEYEFYEKPCNGNLTWIVLGKLLALCTPCDSPSARSSLSLPDYASLFERLNIRLIVRLNEPLYDRQSLLQAGIRHLDLFFADGSTPSADIVNRFLEAVEREGNAVAVHCKAGLGRTGTLIAIYLMKHYKFCASDAIAFLRLMRPGSILGAQQHFLIHNQRHFLRLPSTSFKDLSAEFHAFVKRMHESDQCCTSSLKEQSSARKEVLQAERLLDPQTPKVELL